MLIDGYIRGVAVESWRGSSRSWFGPWLVVLGIVIAVGGGWLTLTLPDKDGGPTPPAFALIPILAGVVVIVAAVLFTKVVLVLDADGVHMGFGPWGRPGRDIAWRQVTGATAVDVRALPWGGWGYRWNPRRKGTAALMRTGPGIQFDLDDGSMLVVTVDDADAGAAVARRWCGSATGG